MSVVECQLCPHACILSDYQTGICKVRVNLEGRLSTLVWGRVSAMHIDPIEKKPLFHFLPSSYALSIATVGCNLSCKFCQNYELSQRFPWDESRGAWEYIPPDKLVQMAGKSNCQSIAYTYSEPMVFYEFTRACATEAQKSGIRNVMVTAGYVKSEPLTELLKVTDAFNTDLKAFDDRFYRDVCNGSLNPVLDGILQTYRAGVWLELTNLIVPGLNDDMDMIRSMVRWILDELGPDVPLHFSRFFPHYKMENIPQTPEFTLNQAWQIARDEGIHYVYVGNLPHPGNHTYCPRCGDMVIKRSTYSIVENKLKINRLTGQANCGQCDEVIAGVWV